MQWCKAQALQHWACYWYGKLGHSPTRLKAVGLNERLLSGVLTPQSSELTAVVQVWLSLAGSLAGRFTNDIPHTYDVFPLRQVNKVGDSRGSLRASLACVIQLCWVPRKMLAGQGNVYACAVV